MHSTLRAGRLLWLPFTALLVFGFTRVGADEIHPHYEIGLSMYSLRQLFQSGELHAFDYPDFAKEKFGITKIDVWDGGFPDGWKNDPNFIPELRSRAEAAGSEIFLVMAGIVNATPSADKALERNGLKYKSYVDMAEALGSEYVRVFVKVDNSAPDEESIRRAAVALGALADYALPKGVTIAIEPTPRSTPLGSYLATLVETVDRPNCRLMPDFGKMKGTDFYQGTEDMMPYTVVVSAKGHDFKPDGTQKDFDYPRLMEIVRKAGFTGIVAIEYEGKNLGPVEGVQAMKALLEAGNQ
ncbi:MAG: sugar phosphate isomerase/epimerase family protein [Verrucomicrobiota bacterium]